MPKYKCSHCGAIFEGLPSYCPQCGYSLNGGQTKPNNPDNVPPQVVESKPAEQSNNDELRKQKTKVIVGFVFAMLATAILGFSSGLVQLVPLFQIDVFIAVIACPASALLAWIFAGVANSSLNKGYDVTGGIKALKIIGKVFAIITLICAILLTIAYALMTTCYFLSDQINQVVDLNMKEMIEKLFTTGKVTFQ